MKIKKFEEIDAWKRARSFSKAIYKISSSEKFSKDWELKEQIRRAALSIMSNIAEGFDSSSKIEFARFLSISRRSASEVQSQLYVALDQDYLDQKDFDFLYKEAEDIRKMVMGFIKYLKGMN